MGSYEFLCKNYCISQKNQQHWLHLDMRLWLQWYLDLKSVINNLTIPENKLPNQKCYLG